MGMKYKVKAVIKDVTMTPNGPIIDQEIISVRRNILDEVFQAIREGRERTETFTTIKTKNGDE